MINRKSVIVSGACEKLYVITNQTPFFKVSNFTFHSNFSFLFFLSFFNFKRSIFELSPFLLERPYFFFFLSSFFLSFFLSLFSFLFLFHNFLFFIINPLHSFCYLLLLYNFLFITYTTIQ